MVLELSETIQKQTRAVEMINNTREKRVFWVRIFLKSFLPMDFRVFIKHKARKKAVNKNRCFIKSL